VQMICVHVESALHVQPFFDCMHTHAHDFTHTHTRTHAHAHARTHTHHSAADGLIEVVAIGGVAHMGRLAVGLARAQRLCQCTSIAITTKVKLPMQVRGARVRSLIFSYSCLYGHHTHVHHTPELLLYHRQRDRYGSK